MENQTRFDLSSPRARIFGAVAFLVAFYVWRSLVYSAWEVFTWLPVLTTDIAHRLQRSWGWFIALDMAIGFPLIVLAASPRLANAAILRGVLSFLYRSPGRTVFWAGLFLILIRCVDFFAWRVTYPEAGELTSPWAHLYGWPNLYPALLLFALFYLHPSRSTGLQNSVPLTACSNSLEGWRRELEAQPGLCAETRRELETHLRDTMMEYRRAGLSEEEAFSQARQRVGSAAQLGSEFVRVQPFIMAREIILWGAASFLGICFWQRIVIDLILYCLGSSGWPLRVPIQLFTWLPPFLLAFFAARKPTTALPAIVARAFANRNHFAMIVVVLLVAQSYLEVLRMHLPWNLFYQAGMNRFLPVLDAAVWPLLLSVVVFFLLPSKPAGSPESAWKAVAR